MGAAATAATWTTQRCFDAGYCASPLCPRCLAHPETSAHRIWGCEHNADEVFAASDGLKCRAQQELEACPAFWLRGLTPSSWTETELPDPDQDSLFAIGKALVEEATAGTYYIDGSGSSSDKRLRRTGWGAVKLESTPHGLEVWGGWFGPVVEPPFTVPRSELIALIHLVKLTTGNITAISDCEYVTEGYRKKRFLRPEGRNGHLWADLAGALREHSGTVLLKWTKAHVSVHEFIERKIPYEQVFGNEVADALAKRAADLVRVDEMRCREIATADAIAWRVRTRIAAATIAAAKHTPVIARRGQRSRLQVSQRNTVAATMQTTSHTVTLARSRVSCSTCKQSRRRCQSLQWLRAPCGGPPGYQRPAETAPALLAPRATIQIGNQTADPSHKIAVFRGATWCWACGAYSTGRHLFSLARACANAPTKRGTDVLTRLRKGLPPKPGCDWPLALEDCSAAFPTPPSN